MKPTFRLTRGWEETRCVEEWVGGVVQWIYSPMSGELSNGFAHLLLSVGHHARVSVRADAYMMIVLLLFLQKQNLHLQLCDAYESCAYVQKKVRSNQCPELVSRLLS